MTAVTGTAIVWYRRDLRVDDHPALFAAARDHDRVVPLYVLDPAFEPSGTLRYRSERRRAHLHGALHALDGRLRERGGRLVVRHGDPRRVVPALADELDARTVVWTADVSRFARTRDDAVATALAAAGRTARPVLGAHVVDVGALATRNGDPYTVFSPFHRAWRAAPRRQALAAPRRIVVPEGIDPGAVPGAPDPDHAGEPAVQVLAERFMAGPVDRYADDHDRLAGGTSQLSPHLRWGTISPAALERSAAARGTPGAEALRRQLAWRDFYAHVLLHDVGSRRPDPPWDADPDGALLRAWQAGRTGYPLVDAGMRQLAATGWMHNRARLVTGSFLTKDLHLDWRLGEAHFARLLLDGEPAQNDGNWRWVASVGVDPAPPWRRMFNPTLQQRRFDPDGAYVRRWVPELRGVPLERLPEPWTMSAGEQAAAGCAIGRDYPAPIVEHQAERRRALERYALARG